MKKDITNKKFWERVAFLYTSLIEKNNLLQYKEICKVISDYLKKDMSVLELACGTGQLTFSLADKVHSWEATDFSENMIEIAIKRIIKENITFSVQDATDLPYNDDSFDAVIIANALHIMPNPEAALGEIYRVLRPNGLLFAPTFVYEEKISKAKIWLIERFGFHTFHKWSSKELSNFVKEKSFTILDQSIIKGAILPECVLIGRKV